jgi:DNA-binding MarR family transcriptional regulator
MIGHHHIDEDVFLLLGRTYFSGKKIVDREFSQLGITISEYSFLRTVENHPHISAVEIGKHFSLSAPSVAQIVRQLLRKGLIQRIKDTSDIRRQNINLTPSGVVAIGKARDIIKGILKKLHISPAVFESLFVNLSVLSSSLSTYGE